MERVCPQCKHTEIKTTLRTTWALYVRCPKCGHVCSANRSAFLDGQLMARFGTNAMTCRRCGGKLHVSYETLPYIAKGPCVVELRNVAVRRCAVCGDMGIDVPDARALDVLLRRLHVETTRVVPQFEYEDGRWRISQTNAVTD